MPTTLFPYVRNVPPNSCPCLCETTATIPQVSEFNRRITPCWKDRGQQFRHSQSLVEFSLRLSFVHYPCYTFSRQHLPLRTSFEVHTRPSYQSYHLVSSVATAFGEYYHDIGSSAAPTIVEICRGPHLLPILLPGFIVASESVGPRCNIEYSKALLVHLILDRAFHTTFALHFQGSTYDYGDHTRSHLRSPYQLRYLISTIVSEIGGTVTTSEAGKLRCLSTTGSEQRLFNKPSCTLSRQPLKAWRPVEAAIRPQLIISSTFCRRFRI